MKMRKLLFLSFCLLYCSSITFGQSSPDYNGGFKVNLSEDGKKQLRIISWGQFWAQQAENGQDANGNDNSDLNLSVRRARVLMYSKINDDFLLLTHFGLNGMNANNMQPVGKGESSQLFLHDAWAQYNFSPNFSIGTGLHYWNGISRLNNQSTLNMLTLDNNRQAWATIGLSDQFARHLGVYAKGKIDKLQYRLSVNESITNSLGTAAPISATTAVYKGRELLGSKEAGKNFAAYLDYQLMDEESNFLPYKVGTYLGKKKILNIGAGFFMHPNGSVKLSSGGLEGEDVNHFAADIFYDAPVGENNAALTAYGLFQSNNYGENYMLGQTYTTGTLLGAHLGYLLPSASKTKLQPYAAYNYRNVDAIDDSATEFKIGSNLYLGGNNSKFSIEYQDSKFGTIENDGVVTLQAMIYL